jgi:nitroimidazol reductase NimA-like FMN-containing flavoprotein (pyridoxamine 5'-phosphate oxidase superfamily)
MFLVEQNHMGRGDDTPLGLRVARNRNGLRAFTTQESHGFSRVECQFSVMVFGTVREVTDLSEATQVLEAMLDKYVPGYFSEPLAHTHVEKYRSSLGSKTVVYRLTPALITAKEGAASPMQLFSRTQTAR